MAGGNLPQNSLVVVATGAEAKLFRNQSPDGGISLAQEGVLTPHNLEDDGPSGVRPPESSLQETDEATFAKQLAQRLYKMAHAGQFDHLALIADPDTLGEIRPILHQEVTEKMVLEQDKTLINASVKDIEKSLQTTSC